MLVKNFWLHERIQTAWGWDRSLCNLVLSTFSASIPPLSATLNIVPSRCDIFFFFMSLGTNVSSCETSHPSTAAQGPSVPWSCPWTTQMELTRPCSGLWWHRDTYLQHLFIRQGCTAYYKIGTVLELFQINIKWFNLNKTTFLRLWMGKVRHREI